MTQNQVRKAAIGITKRHYSEYPFTAAEDLRSLAENLTFEDILGLCTEGCVNKALQVLRLTIRQGQPISANIFYCVLKECIKEKSLSLGRTVCSLIVEGGLGADKFLACHLIRMFGSCGSLPEANQLFQRLPHHNVFTWSAIIQAHTYLGQGTCALELYKHMLASDVKPDSHLFVAVLKACSSIGSLHSGELIHSQLLIWGYEQVVHVGSSVVDMYVKCGNIENARRVFCNLPDKDVVSWNVVISGCAQHLLVNEAFHYFHRMVEAGLYPDQVTLVSLISICARLKIMDKGHCMHAYAVESGYELNLQVVNCLIDMYVKCGRVGSAFNLFLKLPERDVVSWSALMMECTRIDETHIIICFFPHMLREGIVPDNAIFLCLFRACSSTCAFYEGKQIHSQYVDLGMDLSPELSIGNALIDMYLKCGSTDDAFDIFNRLQKRDLVTWNTLIAGCAQYDEYDMALKLFTHLQQDGYKPDNVTFISLFCACNNHGQVETACQEFRKMQSHYGIPPTPEHYNCIVDLLGRAGHLDEAEDFLVSSPAGSDVVGWVSLLNHCKIHGNMMLASRCHDHLVSIKGRNTATFILMSHVYSDCDGHEDAYEVEELRNSFNSWKKPGRAFITIDHHAYEFTVGGRSHSQSDEMYAKVKRISEKMVKEGYLPLMDLVM